MRDQSISAFLASLGYEGTAADPALQALIDAGKTRPGKTRIVVTKLSTAEDVLAAEFLRACTAQPCQAAAGAQAKGTARVVVTVPKEFCDICGGSENARAVREMAQAMQRAGKTRLLIIGGTPNIQRELERLLPAPLEVRFILAGVNKNDRDAMQDAGWADRIAIWASTPISHKTSELYKPYKPITVSRRSISALAGEVTTSITGSR